MKCTPTWIVLGTLAAAAVAGGAAAGGAKKTFSHKYHIADAGAECATCHETGEGDTPLLKNAACADCHDKGTPAWKLDTRARKLRLKFPHQRHAAARGVECKTCHAATATDGVKDGAPLIGFEQCGACHAGRKVAVNVNDCANCHSGSSGGRGVDARAVRPTDHDIGWTTRHGEAAVWTGQGEHGRDCQLCHGTGACRACHLQSAPKSHNGLWRLRTHGAAAGWDRDRCKTCHETGTCVRCHQQTTPMSHAGAWKQTHGLTAGAKDNDRCKACHQTGWCNSCHRLSK